MVEIVWITFFSSSAEFARRLRKRKTKKKKPKKENAEESDSDEEWSKTREYFQTEDEMKLTEEEKADGKSKRIMFVVDAKQQVNKSIIKSRVESQAGRSSETIKSYRSLKYINILG